MSMPPPILLDPNYANRLVDISSPEKIPAHWCGTPIEALIRSHNFGEPIQSTGKPELLIATCIEFRYALPVPSMYAYVLRRASGRLIGSEFSVAYVISRGVRHLALVGHNDCGMAKVAASRQSMVDALVEEGWNHDRAEEYIDYHAARYSIGDEITSLEKEYVRLKRLFRRLVIAPLFYSISDKKVYLPKWYLDRKSKESTSGNEVCDEELLTIM